MTLHRSLAIAVMLSTVACGKQTAAPPPAEAPGSSPNSPITINGTEQIGWNQVASDTGQVSNYKSTAYVDDVPFALDASCVNAAAAFTCVAALPRLSTGPHRIEITQSNAGFESPRSAPLYVVLPVVKIATAVAQHADPLVVTSVDGTRLAVETVATRLDAPSALTATPDGRIFVAQASGEISVWQGGAMLVASAARLKGVKRAPGAGLIGMTLHPEFSTNHLVFMAYVGQDENGTLVNRVARFREFDNDLGEGIVILEDSLAGTPLKAPRIRFGPDKKLYVAFPAGDWQTADRLSSYAGKILRLNDDGTTPRDNPRFSPIISAGHPATGGFDWQPDGRSWLIERDRQGRDVLGILSSEFQLAVSVSFESTLGASGMAFYKAGGLTGFVNDLFIAGLEGQQLRRVRFSRQNANRIETTEGLLEKQFGRLSDVVAGPDGMLYLLTSNRGLSSAAAEDDRLLMLSPAKR
jgi:glucose/arabinose dehydrogenase